VLFAIVCAGRVLIVELWADDWLEAKVPLYPTQPLAAPLVAVVPDPKPAFQSDVPLVGGLLNELYKPMLKLDPLPALMKGVVELVKTIKHSMYWPAVLSVIGLPVKIACHSPLPADVPGTEILSWPPPAGIVVPLKFLPDANK
jgi:hypothetical protein